MSRKLLLATHNALKAEEFNQMLPDFEILNLNDIGFKEEIIENGTSFQENAAIKVEAIAPFYQGLIVSDDSGLVIPALDGEPGIYSARYAGTGNSEDNIDLVLKNLKNKSNREAYFICVICLRWNNENYFFEGRCNGQIINELQGLNGFGYDPIFVPDGYEKTFAELDSDEKNKISHRGKSVEALKKFLQTHFNL